jgi:glycosyltransferase involved in cell wall biosynthesis
VTAADVNRIRHVAVVIPARDEADTIMATIDSVERARAHLPVGVSSTTVVVVDASSDATGTIIEGRSRFPTEGRPTSSIVVRTAHGCVGAARSVGCRVALAGSLHRPRHVWLANTDADTVVPRHWLVAQLELAERHATAVAGTVELGVDVDDHVREQFAAGYETSPDGTHRHVHGANMGTRGDVYLLAGGWKRLHSGEDHDLWTRLGQVTTCVSSTAITVRTSARQVGRAPAGFARDIARITRADESSIAGVAARKTTVA